MASASTSQLPRAYLRMSPNLDMHPDPGAMVMLLCAANRQPVRGRFRDRETLVRILGRSRFKRLQDRGDLALLDDGRWYVQGWDEWQEGDLTVADRMGAIRLRRTGEGPRSGAKRTSDWRLRTRIFERDHYTCRYCGIDDYPREWLVLEHVAPDGPSDEGNLVTACRGCNKRKGGRTPEEAGMVLRDASPVANRDGRDASPWAIGDGAPSRRETRDESARDEGSTRPLIPSGARPTNPADPWG